MISYSTRTGKPKGFKRWLPCYAWDFESLMSPSMFCSKLLGFLPYKYKNKRFEISMTRLAFTAFLGCLHLTLQIYVLYSVNFSDPNNSIFETMPENFFALLEGSIPMLMVLTSYSRLYLLQSVSKISRILSPQDFNDMAKFLHLTYILLFLCHLLYLPIYFETKKNIPFIRRNVNLIIEMASYEGSLFYCNCTLVLGACFKKVNENLVRLKESSTNDQSELTEKHESRRQGVMLLRKVKYYEDVHNEISDAVEHLNKSSRSINIIVTVATFALVTFDVYTCVLRIFSGDELFDNTFSQLEYFLYVLLRLSRFAVLVWVCETAMGYAMEINTTIHDLANSCKDDTIKRQLRYFALQVVHRDNAITTSAFKINGKLLAQVLNGIATYIMILFQFLINSDCIEY